LELTAQDLGSEASVRSYLQNEASKQNVQVEELDDKLTVSSMRTIATPLARPMRASNKLVGYRTKVISITKTAPEPADKSWESEYEFSIKDIFHVASTIEDENIPWTGSPVEDEPRSGEIKVLSAQEACELNQRRAIIDKKTWFSIEGAYVTHVHGAFVNVPGCLITPVLSEESSNRIDSYRRAFNKKCHGSLMNAYVSGKLMGTFEKRRKQFDAGRTLLVNAFIIRDFETNDLSVENITCQPRKSDASPN